MGYALVGFFILAALILPWWQHFRIGKLQEDIDKLQKDLDLGNCNLDTLEENFKKYDNKVCIKYTKKSKTDKGYFIKFPLKNGLKFKEQI